MVTLRRIALAVLLTSGNFTTTPTPLIFSPLIFLPSMPTALLPPPPHDDTNTSTLTATHQVLMEAALLFMMNP
jgi:hypothetical protein